MDINDLQNQLLLYRKKQNQMTIILEQLHSELLLTSDNISHLETRLKTIEDLQEAIIAQNSSPTKTQTLDNSFKYLPQAPIPIKHEDDADNLYNQSLKGTLQCT